MIAVDRAKLRAALQDYERAAEPHRAATAALREVTRELSGRADPVCYYPHRKNDSFWVRYRVFEMDDGELTLATGVYRQPEPTTLQLAVEREVVQLNDDLSERCDRAYEAWYEANMAVQAAYDAVETIVRPVSDPITVARMIMELGDEA